MANVPTTSWSETSPAGGDNLSAGDNRIREMKTQIREVIDVDHDFPSSGQAADVGQHKKMTLQEQADLGSGAEGVPILGAQTVSGKAELVFTDEDDNDIQLTSNGGPFLGAPNAVSDIAGIMNLIYPIGYVITLGVSTNPGTLLGIGTWTAIAGKVIVGIDGTQTEFDTLNETGGTKTVTLDQTMIPSHVHAGGIAVGTSSPIAGDGGSWHASSTNTGSTGGGLAHENMPPYIVKYVWERVS